MSTIATTHVGSLPRPQAVADLLFAQDRGEPVDPEHFEAVMGQAVREVVAKQVQAGVDVVSDGEMSKISYATYIRHRLTGFEPAELPRAVPADLDAFPDFKARLASAGATPEYLRPVCRGPIEVKDLEPLHADLHRLRGAMDEAGASRGFMNAPSPATISIFQPNEFYPSDDEYLEALGEGMRHEYEAIAASGLELQVDCPDLGLGRHSKYRDSTEEEFLARARRHVEVLNHALRDVPRERVRVHACWGNYEGPHIFDIGLDKVAPILLGIDAQTLLFEAANPRHAHEWSVWEGLELPEDLKLAPGCLDTTTNFVEHPALVAERLERYAGLVGPERLVAGTDCGFGTFAGFGAVDPQVCFEKLRSLSEGAALASERLGVA